MEDVSEKEILIRIQQGEIQLFAYFVDKYSKIAFYYTRRKVEQPEDAKDIVQNTFIKTYKAIERIDIRQPFYPYFFTILKNEINQFFRKYRHTVALEDDMASYIDPEIGELPYLFELIKPEYKNVLELYYIEGYSYKEIARILNRPMNTIKTLIRRAKSEVKILYEKNS